MELSTVNTFVPEENIEKCKKVTDRKITRNYQKTGNVSKLTLKEKHKELRQTTMRLKKGAEQLALLNKRLSELGKRYNQAKRDNSKCFLHILEMKLSTVQSMRNMYYNYVYMKAEDVNMLRHEIKHWVEADESESELDEETEE